MASRQAVDEWAGLNGEISNDEYITSLDQSDYVRNMALGYQECRPSESQTCQQEASLSSRSTS